MHTPLWAAALALLAATPGASFGLDGARALMRSRLAVRHAPACAASRVRASAPPDGPAGSDSRLEPEDDMSLMLVNELDAVIDQLKRRGASELNVTDADLEAMRARGATLLTTLGSEINADYANVSAVLAERISEGMAEQKLAAMNEYNRKTAALRKDMLASQARVRDDMANVAALEDKLSGKGRGEALRSSAARSVAGVALALGVYNGGVSLWHYFTFDGAPQAELVNGALDAVVAIAGAAALFTLRSSGGDGEP